MTQYVYKICPITDFACIVLNPKIVNFKNLDNYPLIAALLLLQKYMGIFCQNSPKLELSVRLLNVAFVSKQKGMAL